MGLSSMDWVFCLSVCENLLESERVQYVEVCLATIHSWINAGTCMNVHMHTYTVTQTHAHTQTHTGDKITFLVEKNVHKCSCCCICCAKEESRELFCLWSQTYSRRLSLYAGKLSMPVFLTSDADTSSPVYHWYMFYSPFSKPASICSSHRK